MIRYYACLLLCVFILAGCIGNPLRTSRDEWPEIGNEFAKSLRWSGADLAATFFNNNARADFLTAFRDVGGALKVTNVRHDAVGQPVGSKAQGLLSIEYYRSPSVSVKNATIPLDWSCADIGPLVPCRWQITTSLTRLP